MKGNNILSSSKIRRTDILMGGINSADVDFEGWTQKTWPEK